MQVEKGGGGEMNKSMHTPGPWIVTEHSAGMICVAGPDHKDLCAVGYNRTEGRNDVANANLIAAAPAMYEALETVPLPKHNEAVGEFYTRFYAWYEGQRKQALAQAEGR